MAPMILPILREDKDVIQVHHVNDVKEPLYRIINIYLESS
jgi:hypothetical protein